MPGSYPPAPPTITSNLLRIHQLLQSPTRVSRRLRDLKDLRFVADMILTQRFRTSGGAILYETGETVTNARAIEAVAPGSEYPRDTPSVGTASTAAVSKWGQAVFLSDEKLKRSVYMGREVDRALTKVTNTVVSKIDRLACAAVASNVTATSAALGGWSNETSARMYRDIEIAAGVIVDLNDGFNPDSVLMSTANYALLITDPTIASLRRREASDNPIYGGDVEYIGKYRIIHTASANLPTDDIWVYDSDQLGGMADETDVDPGYASAPNGLQVQTLRVSERDGWDLWARRITVPVVTEPTAGIRITGTDAS
jgi:hypothetical protein